MNADLVVTRVVFGQRGILSVSLPRSRTMHVLPLDGIAKYVCALKLLPS